MKMLDQSTVTVPIYDIIIDSHINTRELDEAVIEEYRESMREYGESNWQRFWNESPRMTESRHLYSGFHTVTAAMREFGREYEINVIQEGKDWREAYFRATRMNATHGRRRTNAEKELAVRRWLEDDEMCQWTDGHIAKECLVSAPFVSKVARSLETISSRPTKRKFVDSDGEIQWIETKQIGAEQTKASQTAEREVKVKTEDQEPLDDDHKHLYNTFKRKEMTVLNAFEAWRGHAILGFGSLDFYGEDGLFKSYLVHEFYGICLPSRKLTALQLKHQIELWGKVYDDLSDAACRTRKVDWIERIKAGVSGQPVEDKAEADASSDADAETNETESDLIGLQEEIQDLLENGEFRGYDNVAWHYQTTEELSKKYSVLSEDVSVEMRTAWEDWRQAKQSKENDSLTMDQFKEKTADERIETSKHVAEAINAAKASFHEHQDALGLKNVSWQQFEERATLEFKRSWAETLFQPVVSPEGESEHSAAKLSYVGSLWVKLKKLTVPPAHGWVKIYAEEIQAKKAAFHALTEMQSKVQAAYQEHLQPHTVYWDAFNEALAANIDSKLAEPVWGGMPVEELEQYTDLYGRVLEAITADAEWVQALKASSLAKKNIQQEKRGALMKEIDELHDAPNGIYGLLPSVDPDTHIAREQFMKINYNEYPAYSWRDRLNFEALEELRDALLQIKQDIVEKGVNWFIPAEPPEPEQSADLQIEPLGPSDSTPEVESEPIDAKSFEGLGSPTKADIRLLASCSNTLLLRDDAPETLKIAASDMLNAIKVFVGTAVETDDNLKHALSTETSASIVKGVT